VRLKKVMKHIVVFSSEPVVEGNDLHSIVLDE
jgi:hypothetical protein